MSACLAAYSSFAFFRNKSWTFTWKIYKRKKKSLYKIIIGYVEWIVKLKLGNYLSN